MPTPGAHTVRYGGNTVSVSVEIEGKVLILDAGTGIRALGTALMGTDEEIFLLLSHLHTDHILGFPYFHPLYEPGRQVHLLDYQKDGKAWSLLDLLNGVHFPLCPEDLLCSYHRVQSDGLAYLREGVNPILASNKAPSLPRGGEGTQPLRFSMALGRSCNRTTARGARSP